MRICHNGAMLAEAFDGVQWEVGWRVQLRNMLVFMCCRILALNVRARRWSA